MSADCTPSFRFGVRFLTALGLVLTTAPSAHADYFDWDDAVHEALCGELLEHSSPQSRFTVEAYTYHSSPGIVYNYDGFVPFVRYEKPTLRKISLRGKSATVSRDVTQAEIDEVRAKGRLAVLRSYEKKIQPEMRALVNKVEDELNLEKISFGVVRDEKGEIVGMARFARAEIKDGKVQLPGLNILRERGLLSEAEDKAILEHFYPEKPRYRYALDPEEIGQIFIEDTLPAEDREAIRRRLYFWISSHLGMLNEEIPILGHTSRVEHYKFWAKTLGLREKLIEKVDPRITETISITTNATCFPTVNALLKRHDSP